MPYILNSQKLRSSVYNEQSFTEVVKQVFASDPSLSNMLSQMGRSGDDVTGCLSNIYNSSSIQSLIRRNISTKTQELRQRVKSQHPYYDASAVRKEVARRLKISVGIRETSVKRVKQVTIAEAVKPVGVGGYTKGSKTIGRYRRSAPRPLTLKEKMFIENRLVMTPKELVKEYYDSGLKFRSESSIKTYQSRLRKSKP